MTARGRNGLHVPTCRWKARNCHYSIEAVAPLKAFSLSRRGEGSDEGYSNIDFYMSPRPTHDVRRPLPLGRGERLLALAAQNLAEERLRALVLGLAKNAPARCCLDDLAVVHEDDAVGDLRGRSPSRGSRQHRHALVGQLDHDVQHFLDHLRIERRGRLVEQHQRRASCTARARSPRAAAGRRTAGRDTCRACSGMRTRSRVARARSPRPRAAASCAPSIGASVQFSSTVRCGNRLNCWNTMPTSRRTCVDRARRSSSSSVPSTMMRPSGAPRAG